ncbi:MAG: thioesterase family protein [Parvibaculum sp.]|uniref:thioesterase family protein n=1 Tax=Parvibaculum sp. TaxID=2024848 RepID=UPI00271AC9B8|nr:thioesterase family protein [Parvibaculum sp.]MDO8837462.1 thioesterase family protein [Parvibaculum sp.]
MNAPSPDLNSVFRRDGEVWNAHPQAQGPFGGMHGGAAAALAVGEMEIMAAARGLGGLVSAQLYLLRPMPRDGLTSKVSAVREGGRVAVFENEIYAGGKLQAKASACFQQPVEIDGLPGRPETRLFEPAAFPAWERPASFKSANPGPGFLDLCDIRDTVHADGTRAKWFRLKRVFHETPTPFSNAMAVADVSTLFTVTDAGTRPNAAGWPNADLSLHLSRDPIGEWIGVAQRGDWRGDGRGMTESEIFDVYGRIGRSCQSAVLLALT